MHTTHQPLVQQSQQQKQTIAITATFTAEPVEESLAFWMRELDIPATVEFAPYNQVFQQLLDPSSLLAQNQHGINIILLRLEDWYRFDNEAEAKAAFPETVERNLRDLVMALKSAIGRSATPCIVCLCPGLPAAIADESQQAFLDQMEDLILSELQGISGLYLISSQNLLASYSVTDYYDAQTDKLGHIPFTPVFFTALGTKLARKIHAIESKPYKVVVLDCDNTLWKGVVGEDGVMGIELPPAWRALQEFIVAQQNAGMLICLCSKNNELDVIEVFNQRPEMPLKLEQIVSWRINWLPKSENIKSLAQELNLGLDSIIFIDDNPVECAEVQANCPEVLTLQLPSDSDIPRFLNHVWAFDRLKVTDEDRQRTAMYKQNLERSRFEKEALTLDQFLAGLALKVEISEPSPSQLPRISQLTQRTNQFNFTTVRRSESEIKQLSQLGLECRMVEVSDRFGSYGLVGVMIFGTHADALEVDTFLLSCRVLGRGVEHRMLAHLAEIAKERNLATVNISYISTKKNLPALNFIESVAADLKRITEDGFRFCIPVEFAAAISSTPGNSQKPNSDAPIEGPIATHATVTQSEKSRSLSWIANQMYDPEQILQLIESQQRPVPQLERPFVAARTETEKQLVHIWTKLLRIEKIGIQDLYFELGGTSLLAVQLFSNIEKVFKRSLPLTTILEVPTVEQLANLIDRLGQLDASSSSLVLLKDGASKPPLFLIHDGFGETLLYLNLARHLQPERSVYGLQPLSREGYPILHTRIADMAAYYTQKIRTVQPVGPYLLGGLCAGGVLAFEIARHLQNQEQQVAMVAIIDAADVEAPKRIGRIASQRISNFSTVLGQNQQLSLHKRLFQIVNKATKKIINLAVYESQANIEKIRNTVKMMLFRYYLDKGLSLPKYLRNISVQTVFQFAEREHISQELYEGEVVLFRATEGEGSDEPYVNIYNDPLLGWSKKVTQEVRVYDIPGGHSSMLQEPNMQVMAERMQTYINEVLPQESNEVRSGRKVEVESEPTTLLPQGH